MIVLGSRVWTNFCQVNVQYSDIYLGTKCLYLMYNVLCQRSHRSVLKCVILFNDALDLWCENGDFTYN